jgi:hypothetical protein
LRKLLLLAGMLAMVLVVASPALAQTVTESGAGNQATQVCQAANVNLQYQSTGDVTQTINQNCLNNAGNVNVVDVEGDVDGKKFVTDDGKKFVNDFVVDGGKKFVAVGHAVQKGVEAPVFVDHKGKFFTIVKDNVSVVKKDTVTFFDTAVKKHAVAAPVVKKQYAAPAVQYQYKAGAVQYQYAAPLKKAHIAVLPDTGGASLITLGAGALLVAGGLLARRIVR